MTKPTTARRIPIRAGKEIADCYGYDQVVIVARKVGEGPGTGEHVTTYGVNKEHCSIAARIGNFFKYKLMAWPDSAADAAQPTGRDEVLRTAAQRMVNAVLAAVRCNMSEPACEALGERTGELIAALATTTDAAGGGDA